MNLLKQYYTTVFAQTYSPCGKYLAAANNYGHIGLFNLSNFLSTDESLHAEEEQRYSMYKFQAHCGPIYSMVSNDNFIVSGGIGEICGWRWSDVKKKDAKVAWSFTVPQGENLTKPEVNGLALSSQYGKSLLYAGCGDNKIYCWDLDTGAVKQTLEGHTDYIHCLTLSSTGQECFSGSEDGTLRIWDTRKAGDRAIHIIQPFKHENLHRPRFGKWIGCVALDNTDDWMVCGGGPSLCLWHVRSQSPATPLLTPDATTTAAFFHDDMIVSGGSQPFVNHWSFNGELKGEVPTSVPSIYSICVSISNNQKVLSVGGTSYKIDICTNFMYRDFSLIFS